MFPLRCGCREKYNTIFGTIEVGGGPLCGCCYHQVHRKCHRSAKDRTSRSASGGGDNDDKRCQQFHGGVLISKQEVHCRVRPEKSSFLILSSLVVSVQAFVVRNVEYTLRISSLYNVRYGYYRYSVVKHPVACR